ncbi:MAG TPA: hypothetical protein VL068_15175 [Microthrixaceae bacterium]|nr:hypothetical protein [Microthrixaceae bacterium]
MEEQHPADSEVDKPAPQQFNESEPTDADVDFKQAPGPSPINETLVVFVMGFTAILTAWTGFQGVRWSGVQSQIYNEAAALRAEASRYATQAAHQKSVDLAVFIAWVNATASGDSDQADFARNRFTDAFRPAFDAWLQTDPLNSPDALATPFDMPEYDVAEGRRSNELLEKTRKAETRANDAGERVDSQSLMAVLFATVLFFASMSLRFRSRRSQVVILDMAIIGMIGGLVAVLFLL